MYDVNLPEFSCRSSSSSPLEILAAFDKETAIAKNVKATNDAIVFDVTTAVTKLTARNSESVYVMLFICR